MESERYNEVVWDRLPEWLRALPQPANAIEIEEVVISLRHLVLTVKGSTVEAGPPKGPAS